jgi:hypothetical protein
MKRHLDNFITSAIDYLFRPKSVGAKLIRYSIPLIIAPAGLSFYVSLDFPTENGIGQFSLSSGGGTPFWITLAILLIGIALLSLGIYLVWFDHKKSKRKRIYAIELRGLRDFVGDPLLSSIPKRITGKRDEILVDLRQGADGKVLDPKIALKKLSNLPDQILNTTSGLDRSDLSFYAGGLAPVPYCFLFGLLLDDENRVELRDWDRKTQCWRKLEEDDDKDRFSQTDLTKIGTHSEIVLSVSVSYPTDTSGIKETFPELPIIETRLGSISADTHWSSEKQLALADQFFQLAKNLSAKNVQTIHLIIASPASLVIQFGKIYDKRNLPSIVVYQYERGTKPECHSFKDS